MRIVIFLILLGFSFCQRKENNNSFYHLVIDAGSSGTRFCLYEIQKNQNQCMLKNYKESCKSIPAKNGIANLTKEEIEFLLDQGFHRINQKKIEYISLLGTGGFRKLSEIEQKEKYRILSDYFSKIPIKFNIKFITGKEEAYFAWKSIQILYNSNSHFILETGGATIQLAYGNLNDFQSISLPLGMNLAYEKLKQKKEFEKCSYGKVLSSKDFDDCKNFVIKEYQNYIKKTFSNQTQGKNKIYTLGKPWETIFLIIGKKSLEKEELNNSGKKICSLGKNDLKKLVKTEYIDRVCYLFYYHVAQIEFFEIQEVDYGTSSWSIGASISSIPDCEN